MEVGVKVWVENYIARHSEHVSSAYLTFVAVDGKGHHLSVPPVIPETDEQKRRYEDAGRRREIRRAHLAAQEPALVGCRKSRILAGCSGMNCATAVTGPSRLAAAVTFREA
jgi:hypothetical protein